MNNTILFKNAIGDSIRFINSNIAVETIQGMLDFMLPPNWVEDIYRLLIRRYRNWEIGFDNVDDFLDLLWEKIEIHAPNYYERRRRYSQLLNLTDAELLTTSLNISNFTDHTDDREEDPLNEPLKNITSQNASKNYGDKASRLRSQLYNARATLIDDFLNNFKNLFIRCTTSPNYII